MIFRPLAFVGGLLLSASAACAQSSPTPPSFDDYLGELRETALSSGIRPETVDAIFPGLSFDSRVVELDRQQPDDSRTAAPPSLAGYLEARLTPERISEGRIRYRDAQVQLARAEAATGVPAPILAGIWGMETFYGRATGSKDLFQSLASLAYDGRRRDLFAREFLAALRIVDKGLAPRERLVGSWAGATGMPQFLPSSYLASARDGDGDGWIDIWYSKSDTFASIGTYLKQAGWKPGLPWGLEAAVPAGLDRAALATDEVFDGCVTVQQRHSRWLSLADWERLGVRPLTAAGLEPTAQATLIEPDGPGGRAFLAFNNYRALLNYNCSNYYVISVGLLADAIKI